MVNGKQVNLLKFIAHQLRHNLVPEVVLVDTVVLEEPEVLVVTEEVTTKLDKTVLAVLLV